MYFLFYILLILMVICIECSIIRANRFVFVFCLYFSHLVHRFSQQNGPSIWHKRFLRLLCTSKGKKEKRRFCGVFSPSLCIFFFFLHRQTPSQRLYYTSYPDPPPPTTHTATTYIFYPTL